MKILLMLRCYVWSYVRTYYAFSLCAIFSVKKTGASWLKRRQDFHPPSSLYQRTVPPTCFSLLRSPHFIVIVYFVYHVQEVTIIVITEGEAYISNQSGDWSYEGGPIPEYFADVNVVDGVLMIGNASPQCSGMYTVKDDKSGVVSSFLISESCGDISVVVCTSVWIMYSVLGM